ncbi:MAG: hypothetical protein LBU69_00480 [Deltaproteobacteria bacterium]|jgi:hypothetical protein|nr:hypothetical protein [Deltaproteobacteria bacterium]
MTEKKAKAEKQPRYAPKMYASVGPNTDLSLHRVFNYSRKDGEAEGRPYGMAWMAIDALRETDAFTGFSLMSLNENSYGRAVAVALIAARLEKPARLAETLDWLREASGILPLLGLKADSGWESIIDHVLDYVTVNVPNLLPITDLMPGTHTSQKWLVFTYDPTCNFLDDPDFTAGAPKGANVFVTTDVYGRLVDMKVFYPKDDGAALTASEKVKSYVNEYREYFPNEWGEPIYVVGPWDRGEMTKALRKYKAEYLEIKRIEIPEGPFAPGPGEIEFSYSPGGDPAVYVWGYPGYGPLLSDLGKKHKPSESGHSILKIPQGLVAFEIPKHDFSENSGELDLIGEILRRSLTVNGRFRHLAIPGYPGDPKGHQDSHPFRDAHYATLGALAYQCLNYIRDMLFYRDKPFDWVTLRGLLGTHTISVATAPGKPDDHIFGEPSKKLKDIYKSFDMLDKPLLKYHLDPGTLKSPPTGLINEPGYAEDDARVMGKYKGVTHPAPNVGFDPRKPFSALVSPAKPTKKPSAKTATPKQPKARAKDKP